MNESYRDKTHKQLFISGPPRSGTTLLELILMSHSDICITPENYCLENIFKNKSLFFNHKIIDPNILIEILKKDKKLNNWPKFKLDDFLRQYPIDEKTKVDQLINNMFIFYADSFGKKKVKYIGNKKGLYATGYGSFVKKIFPEAKFIYILRDPKDVVYSIIKNLNEKSVINAAFRCYYVHKYIAKMKKRYDKDILIIRYEELTKLPYKVLQNVCEFLSIKYEINMINFFKFNKNSELLIYEKRNIHKNTTKPIDTQYTGQWKRKNYFKRFEIRIIESICLHYMRYFHYDFIIQNSNLSKIILNNYYIGIYKTLNIIKNLKYKMEAWCDNK